jgi:hypothetical protein
MGRLHEIAAGLADVAKVETPPRMTGKRMNMVLAPIKKGGPGKAEPAAAGAPAAQTAAGAPSVAGVKPAPVAQAAAAAPTAAPPPTSGPPQPVTSPSTPTG